MPLDDLALGLQRALDRLVRRLLLGAAPAPGRRRFLIVQSVGLPTSTPAFQMAAMYGVRPDIPGFHYHDKRRKADVYFPRGGDAATVEKRHADGRRGIVAGGSTYGCVFTGG